MNPKPAACREEIHGFAFHALGGPCRLRFSKCEHATARHAVIEATAWLRKTEAKLSRFREDSLTSRLNCGLEVEPDHDLLELIRLAQYSNQRTEGRLDITSLPLWRLWHDPRRNHAPTDDEVAQASKLRGVRDISCMDSRICLPRKDMAVDFGSIAKEWCVDEVVRLLSAMGMGDFMVELSGDIAARGGQSDSHDGWWIMTPRAGRAVLLRNSALATSGHGARRRLLAGRSISHLIDACTGLPASGVILAATVMAPSCFEAGLLASDAALADDTRTALSRMSERPGIIFTRNAVIADDRIVADSAEVAIDNPQDALRCAALTGISGPTS